MAPSFRDLIDYLLAEIALCGDQGASPADILAFTNAFYAKPNASSRTHTVDRRFQEKVWKWLTKNPEVSIGDKKEGNHLSLLEVEARDQENGGQKPLRAFVSEERTWLAVTGHEPDETKIFPTEFALLSIIAARKSNGIPQTELVRISGQDKRSVPKRTDMLAQKGYIEKRAVQIKSARTSICTLRKFLNDENRAPEPTASATADQMIDFKAFTNDLFKIMREHNIISRIDLKTILGFADRWRWRILSRTLRKFERIGVLKRVRAMSQYADTMGKYHPCVMLVREPTQRDIENFHEFSRNMIANPGQDDNEELEEEMEPNEEGKASSSFENGVLQGEQNVEDVGRVVPSWSPDRNIHNMVFDTVHRTGTDGMINQELIKSCFGAFFRRPLENALMRLVECWQFSQPLHLRHLALVRDTGMTRTIHHYVHYSVVNFAKRVEEGNATWEAVEFVSKNSKSNNFRAPPIHATPQVDEYGLPLAVPKLELVKHGSTSLLSCLAVVKPQDYTVTSSDPTVAKLEDGTYGLRFRQKGAETPFQQHVAGVKVETPSKTKPEPVQDEDTEMESTPRPASVKKKSKKAIREEMFRQMSEKERLEHLGMDETWTEYAVLLLERPKPGVYLTSRGRRRPAGKRQGRPRTSRVAVFKSPRLSSFPWFVKEVDESNGNQKAPTEQAPSTPVPETAKATGVRGKKRGLQPTSPESGTAWKQRRLETSGPDSMDSDTAEVHTHETGDATKSSKRKRAVSPEVHQGSDATLETPGHPRQETQPASNAAGEESPSKRPHHEPSGDDKANIVLESVGTGDSSEQPEADASKQASKEPLFTATSSAVAPATPSIPGFTQKGDQPSTPASIEPASSPAAAQQSSKGHPRMGRGKVGGSIGFLRRKIINEILDQAGGAFPLGAELWYPFTTAWAKMKFKEKPDLRTIKNTVKHMVDAGNLRQFTFSGKDSKGVMVTKTIIAKTDMNPDDPFIQDMQKNMLATESKLYIPPTVEYDKEMTKAGRRVQPQPTGKAISQVPIEPTVTVHLHQKPAFVMAQEKRRGQMIQRRLLQKLESERELLKGPNVVRLMKIQRAPKQDRSAGLTSIARPGQGDGSKQRRIQKVQSTGGIKRPKRLEMPISKIGPYAIIMNPRQEFHSSSGTFSTNAGLAALQIARPKPREAPPPLESPKAKKTVRPGLPDSLDDLFNMVRRRRTARAPDPDQEFFRDTGTIMRWELRNEDLFLGRSEDFHYINQTVANAFESAPIGGAIRFESEEEEEESMSQPEAEAEAGQPKQRRTKGSKRKARQAEARGKRPLRPLAPLRRRHGAYNVEDSEADLQHNRRLEKLYASAGAEPTTYTVGSHQPIRRVHRNSYYLSKSFVQKLMTAIVVVRTLAGGQEGKVVDWTLVPICFPDYDPMFVQERGKYVINRNRLQLAKMQSDFQSRFIEAYARGEVPSINYEDLENYDWVGVVDWAKSQLELPTSEKIPDLPATREQFDGVFELRVEPSTSLDDIYHSSHNVTMFRKRTAYAEVPFAMPHVEKPSHVTPRKAELARLEVAKSYVRANIVATEESYRPSEAHATLESLPGDVLQSALQSLITERVISSNNKGRPAPGRNYDITDYFLQILNRKRAIESSDLRRAARFKIESIDPALRSHGKYDIDGAAEDGDIMAIINLYAEGRVFLRPRDPPRNKKGLIDGGYTTRQMDKRRLIFGVEVRPVEGRYVYGNPVEEKVSSIPTPCPPLVKITETISAPEKIPLWYDIHHQFVKVLWEMAVSAVVGSVAIRPGLSASGLASMLKPTLGVWEVELLLRWMEQVGVMREEGGDGQEKGWRVQEWWWMVL